jgi:hypothetical protein
MRRVLVTAVLILLILSGVWFAVSAYTLARLEVGEMDVTAMRDPSLDGVTVAFTVELVNPGVVPATIRSGEYRIVFPETGEEIGSGTIASVTVPARSRANVTGETRTTWKPGVAVAARALAGGEATATVTGTVRTGGPIGIDVPFETEVDLAEYLRSLVPREGAEVLAAVFGLGQ